MTELETNLTTETEQASEKKIKLSLRNRPRKPKQLSRLFGWPYN